MTLLAVPIFVTALEDALAAAARAAEQGADLVEFRLDGYAGPPDAVPDLVNRAALPCIVTVRPVWEGGRFEGDEEARLALFQVACSGPRKPAYLDVELAAYLASPSFRRRVDALVDQPGRPRDTGLILSSHDFQTRPADLLQRLEAMVAAPACRVSKLAWRARSLRDNLEAFELLQHRHKPAIALCMGEHGLPSRVLARKFGALLTFAALDAASGTAPGQPALADLRRLYRWARLGPDTRVYGVIGHPVGHSMSPAIHNAGFDAVDFDGVYLPLAVPPEYEHFKATVGSFLALPDLHFRGASVTIPHKENLLRFVRESGGQIEPLAAAIGVANTLVVGEDGGLWAGNTDYAGAIDALCDSLGITREGLAGQRVAVIGAGGAARAIVAGLAHYGATVVIYNRTLERAAELAAQFDGRGGKVVAARLEKLCDSCCRVFINCTPIGMHPKVEDTPMPSTADTRGWGPDTVVFDTVYNPVRTRLLREAAAAGCRTVSGVEMFVRQAAGQFQAWTGRAAPVEVFRRVLHQRLGG